MCSFTPLLIFFSLQFFLPVLFIPGFQPLTPFLSKNIPRCQGPVFFFSRYRGKKLGFIRIVPFAFRIPRNSIARSLYFFFEFSWVWTVWILGPEVPSIHFLLLSVSHSVPLNSYRSTSASSIFVFLNNAAGYRLLHLFQWLYSMIHWVHFTSRIQENFCGKKKLLHGPVPVLFVSIFFRGTEEKSSYLKEYRLNFVPSLARFLKAKGSWQAPEPIRNYWV